MMKTFRFRLRRLAAVRRLEERQAEGARLLAEARLRDVDASRDAMTADRDALLGGLATTLRAGGGSPEAPRRALEHAARLDAGLRRLEAERERAVKALADAVDEARRRRVARKALDELEKRRRDAWREESAKAEADALDEIASARHAAALAARSDGDVS